MAQVGPNVAAENESKRSVLERARNEFISLIDSKDGLDQMIHRKYLEMCMGSNLHSGHESQRFLENNTAELKLLIDRIYSQLWEIIQLEHPSMCMEPNLQTQYQSKRSALEIAKKEFIALIDRKDPLEQIIQQELLKCMAKIGPDFPGEYEKQRSALEITKKEFISLIDRIDPEGISLLLQYQSDRSAIEKTKMELRELFERWDALDQKNQRHLETMAQVGMPLHSEYESTSSKQSASSSILHQLRQWFPVWKSTGSQSKRSNPKQEKDEQLKLLKSIATMQDTNARIRNELENTKKEFESFKDRVAEEVCHSIKSENTVCMNNPLSKIRLKEMYDELSSQWPKIKEHLRSNTESRTVESLIKEAFGKAQKDMEEKKEALNKVFELNELSCRPITQKITECNQSTNMKLQLLLFYSRKNEGSLKTFLSGQKTCKDVQNYLYSECYWLGCLMALNNPTLRPDWQNHQPEMDPWNIFPQHFESQSVV